MPEFRRIIKVKVGGEIHHHLVSPYSSWVIEMLTGRRLTYASDLIIRELPDAFGGVFIVYKNRWGTVNRWATKEELHMVGL
jgi:hypothetical protein